jgi:dienelactone hydrolase
MKTLFSALLLVVAAVSAQAKIVTKPVAYEHDGVKLEGYLAYDDATKSARPGVLIVHEWRGLNDYIRERTEQVAKMGYVAFAVDMYGKGVETKDPKKAQELAGPFYGSPLMAQRAAAGLDQLMKTGLVDKERVAAIGFCFGGSTCQALAYTGAPLAGVVSFHGGLIPASPEAAKAIKAKLLILNGAADPFVKPEDVTAFKKALEAAKVDYQFIDYSEAVHAFTNPGADKIHADTGIPVGYNANAARRSWKQMQVFFDEIFAK